MADKHGGRRSQNGKRGWVRVEAYAAVIEDQYAVENVQEDRTEFSLDGIDSLAAFEPSAGVKKTGADLSEKDGYESRNFEIRSVNTPAKSEKHKSGGEGD
jgi:hypothetical protein